MIRKRIDRENRIIAILAILCVVCFAIYGIVHMTQMKSAAKEAEEYNTAIGFPDSIKCIEAANSSGEFILDYDAGNWKFRGNEKLPVNKAKVLITNQIFKDLEAQRILEGEKVDLAEVGLEKPQAVLKVKGDSTEKTFRIGIKNPALGEYYVMVDGDESRIYLVDAEGVSLINRSINQFVGKPTIVGNSVEDLTRVSVKGVKNFEVVRNTANENFTATMDGESFQTSDYRVSSLYAVVNSAEFLCAYFNAGEAEMQACGLQEPDITMEYDFADGSHYKIIVGVSEDNMCYLNENDSNLIYQIAGETYLQIVALSQGTSLK